MDAMERPDEREGLDLHLPPDLSEFVNEEVRRGDYASPDEVVREALHRMAEDRRARQELSDAIDVGWAQSEAGLMLDPDEVFAEIRLASKRTARTGSESLSVVAGRQAGLGGPQRFRRARRRNTRSGPRRLCDRGGARAHLGLTPDRPSARRRHAESIRVWRVFDYLVIYRPETRPLRRCAQADRDDHRGARRAQDPRATSSCPAPRRRSLPPERLPSPSSPGSPRRERAAHLQRGAVWRSRAPGRKPSASGRLDATPEALQNSMTCVRGTGSTRPWARPTGYRPELLPSAGGHLLGVPIPRLLYRPLWPCPACGRDPDLPIRAEPRARTRAALAPRSRPAPCARPPRSTRAAGAPR